MKTKTIFNFEFSVYDSSYHKFSLVSDCFELYQSMDDVIKFLFKDISEKYDDGILVENFIKLNTEWNNLHEEDNVLLEKIKNQYPDEDVWTSEIPLIVKRRNIAKILIDFESEKNKTGLRYEYFQSKNLLIERRLKSMYEDLSEYDIQVPRTKYENEEYDFTKTDKLNFPYLFAKYLIKYHKFELAKSENINLACGGYGTLMEQSMNCLRKK